MAYTSPAWPITVAHVGALVDTQAVTDLIGEHGVYADEVPADTPLPYITLGSSSETPRPMFSRSGAENTDELHIWADTRREVQQIFGVVAPVLQGAQLTVEGHQMIVSRIELVATMRDPTGISHGVARYTVQTVKAAA